MVETKFIISIKHDGDYDLMCDDIQRVIEDAFNNSGYCNLIKNYELEIYNVRKDD